MKWAELFCLFKGECDRFHEAVYEPWYLDSVQEAGGQECSAVQEYTRTLYNKWN